MDFMEVVRKRRSVRTFDGVPLREEDRAKIAAFIEDVPNPYGIPVELTLLGAKENGLKTPVIEGESHYILGKVARVEHFEEAFGISFEKVVLYATSLGIGTTWIGGTLDRALFEKACHLGEDECMCCVTPLGYVAQELSRREDVMRRRLRADHRLPAAQLFFAGDFATPLPADDPAQAALEAVRWAPSAVNQQPWRVVKDGQKFHFYLKHNKGYRERATFDVQKVDIGIALCHFLEAAGGTLAFEDPGISLADRPEVEYIATVTV